MELVDSRSFKVPKSRINKFARMAGLPNDVNPTVTERAETSISEETDAADDNSEANTFDSG